MSTCPSSRLRRSAHGPARGSRFRFPLAVLPFLLLPGCAGGGSGGLTTTALPGTPVQVAGGSYGNVSVEELRGMLANRDVLLINVHIPFEGDLPGTDDSIAFNEITQHLDRLPEDRDTLVFLPRCARGWRRPVV